MTTLFPSYSATNESTSGSPFQVAQPSAPQLREMLATTARSCTRVTGCWRSAAQRSRVLAARGLRNDERQLRLAHLSLAAAPSPSDHAFNRAAVILGELARRAAHLEREERDLLAFGHIAGVYLATQ
jgi:hypothetical protein